MDKGTVMWKESRRWVPICYSQTSDANKTITDY